jgi:hypothetical protein
MERLMLSLNRVQPTATRNVIGDRGILVMDAASLDRLGQRAPQKRVRRPSTMVIRMLSALLAVAIGAIPARVAFAGQTLELPQTAAPVTSASTPIGDTTTPEPQPQAIAALPAGLGSIDDYESQDSDARPAPTANRVASRPFDRQSNHPSMANDVILGALILGVLAMELSGGHRHR